MVSKELPADLKIYIEDKLIKPHPRAKDENEHYKLLSEAFFDVENGESIIRQDNDGSLRFGFPRAPGTKAGAKWSGYENLANNYFLEQTESFLNDYINSLVETRNNKMPFDGKKALERIYNSDQSRKLTSKVYENDFMNVVRAKDLIKKDTMGNPIGIDATGTHTQEVLVDLIKGQTELGIASHLTLTPAQEAILRGSTDTDEYADTFATYQSLLDSITGLDLNSTAESMAEGTYSIEENEQEASQARRYMQKVVKNRADSEIREEPAEVTAVHTLIKDIYKQLTGKKLHNNRGAVTQATVLLAQNNMLKGLF
ncbi:hypothetical protein HN924_02455 [Candidatus Woesearchaeota archaeon]|jgi:hypothetical protein|nr:hypothetical protein [Candidatus Woesearchaeota archaeon]MBT7062806.1 hypothetical protein [Candidatus Woesearchaeota archaeon]MBT7403032.1 hypothetical protein [Candidatus Woesearchaeota archaeon]